MCFLGYIGFQITAEINVIIIVLVILNCPDYSYPWLASFLCLVFNFNINTLEIR